VIFCARFCGNAALCLRCWLHFAPILCQGVLQNLPCGTADSHSHRQIWDTKRKTRMCEKDFELNDLLISLGGGWLEVLIRATYPYLGARSCAVRVRTDTRYATRRIPSHCACPPHHRFRSMACIGPKNPSATAVPRLCLLPA
jgi:hypothetical protein